jgi:hypothetical protein
MKTLPAFAIVLAASVWTINSAQAAAIIFDDTSPAETITVFADGFEGGLFLNGALFQSGLGRPATTTLLESLGAISFSGTFAAPGIPPRAGTRTIYLLEPDLKTLSDTLDLTWSYDGTMATVSGSFTSDVEGLPPSSLPPGVDPADVFVESGRPVGIGMDFFNVEVRSDVPESGSFWLLPFSLGSIGYFRSRYKARP